ncbi:RluA family pseudouridine synthase [Acetobacterium woodii]|uniref:Pseudouridine synthase n=1 Tax=Acetobacterium woodii (strain ATCC 29683 / DSM 1030 / JCM 2381 / KCTC 1655 / WB1) TaxID=931626 RepID=H6LBI8_ACEWD|nr:RluA family pseudouridine synthase [Acetobacterium woodii]AFA48943.1 pseudouridine synthase RluA [Acetobacterium woodii DSM 1030]
MNKQYEYIVPAEIDERLDHFCCTLPGDYSREYIKKLIGAGDVLVNGQKKKVSLRLKGGETISLMIPDPIECHMQAEDIPLDIVFEDEDVIVVNKPQGMVVHPAPGNLSGTLVNGLIFHTKNLSNINGVLRPGIIHRIDKDTSGLLMVAKNDQAHRILSEQLKEHTILRRYYGLVKGTVKPNRGTVDMPIGRHEQLRIKMAVVEKNSKPAITHFEVVKRYAQYTLLRFQLETGRTHQIRVHLEKIGHPLAGDPLYGKGDKNNPFKTSGQCLHAHTLGFIHPRTGENLVFRAPLPKDFQTILKNLK